jgi:hypothetical protein
MSTAAPRTRDYFAVGNTSYTSRTIRSCEAILERAYQRMLREEAQSAFGVAGVERPLSCEPHRQLNRWTDEEINRVTVKANLSRSKYRQHMLRYLGHVRESHRKGLLPVGPWSFFHKTIGDRQATAIHTLLKHFRDHY